MSTQTRPTGVTIIAILEIISGIVAIGFGILFGTLMGGMGMGAGSNMMMAGSGFAWAFGIVSGVTIVLGLLSFLMAWGLLKGKPWAWTITLILTIIGLVFDVPSMNIIGIIIGAVILYYLFRPHVKAYFGKGPQVQ